MKSGKPLAASEIQEAGQEAPLGGHQTRTLAAPWAGGAQARQGNNPSGADERAGEAAAASRGAWEGAPGGQLVCRTQIGAQQSNASVPKEGDWARHHPVVGAFPPKGLHGPYIETGSRQDPSFLGLRPQWSQDHSLHAAEEPSPAPQLAGAAQEVAGAWSPPEASTGAAGGREPICVRGKVHGGPC